jgi:hypothetical protein
MVQCSVPKTFFIRGTPYLSKTHDGTPQNFASQTGDMKLYIFMAKNMYLHLNTLRMKAYDNNTNICEIKISVKKLCVCVCVCLIRILITKDKILLFSNYNVRIHNFL